MVILEMAYPFFVFELFIFKKIQLYSTLEYLINVRGTLIFLGNFSGLDTLIRDRTFIFFSIFSALDYYKEPYLLFAEA